MAQLCAPQGGTAIKPLILPQFLRWWEVAGLCPTSLPHVSAPGTGQRQNAALAEGYGRKGAVST